MAKFKVGDKIRCVTKDWSYCAYKPDKTYTVRSVMGDSIVTDLDGNGNGENGWYENNFELVTPAHLSPIREVTKRELVSGQYGKVTVNGNRFTCGWIDNAQDLRAAAKTLTEIADFLEEQ